MSEDDEPLAGEPQRIAALVAAETQLGVRFPAAYRAFIADRGQYEIAVKHIDLYPVDDCYSTDANEAVVIGQAYDEHASLLVFKKTRTGLSDDVYTFHDRRFELANAFGSLVERHRAAISLAEDPRVRLAERLGGAARRCVCGREARVGQICACGSSATPRDPAYVLSAEEEASARADHPFVWRAAQLVRDLKARGHVVPGGPKQLLAVADVLAATPAPEMARAVLATWKKTGMKVDVDEATVAGALERGAQ